MVSFTVKNIQDVKRVGEKAKDEVGRAGQQEERGGRVGSGFLWEYQVSDTVTHVHSRVTTVEPRLKDLFQIKLVRASRFACLEFNKLLINIRCRTRGPRDRGMTMEDLKSFIFLVMVKIRFHSGKCF